MGVYDSLANFMRNIVRYHDYYCSDINMLDTLLLLKKEKVVVFSIPDATIKNFLDSIIEDKIKEYLKEKNLELKAINIMHFLDDIYDNAGGLFEYGENWYCYPIISSLFHIHDLLPEYCGQYDQEIVNAFEKRLNDNLQGGFINFFTLSGLFSTEYIWKNVDNNILLSVINQMIVQRCDVK